MLTRLGGSLMDGEVLDAMRAAAGAFVDIAELQTRAGAAIAAHIGAQAAIVTAGAAAALTLATAACMTGADLARMERLPESDGMPNEVIIHRAHRTSYDHAIRAAGAKLVEIGFNDRGAGAGVRALEPWEIEAVVGPRTAAIAYTATPDMLPSLASVVRVAARFKLPVIVDAAAQLPPKTNLQRFIAEGATLVAFSGGKAIRGPQGTGVLCGREDLVAAALVQMLDMDVLPQNWAPPAGMLSRHFRERFPHHGIGRGFKVDKESIIGLVVALDRFVASDLDAQMHMRALQLARLAETISDLYFCSAGKVRQDGRYPTLALSIDASGPGGDALSVSRALQHHDPPVHLSERFAFSGVLIVDSAALRPGDEDIVAKALHVALGAKVAAPRSSRATKG
jgi:L-seryl-tRNA(Ser) seleniumtransferase